MEEETGQGQSSGPNSWDTAQHKLLFPSNKAAPAGMGKHSQMQKMKCFSQAMLEGA